MPAPDTPASPITPDAAPGASLRRRIDGAGVLLSGLCLIHCLAGLVLVTLLGLGGGVLLAPQWHEWGLGLAIAVGAVGLGLGALRHRRLPILLQGAAGLALMGLALMVGHGAREAGLTIAGVLLVGQAHIRNLRHGA